MDSSIQGAGNNESNSSSTIQSEADQLAQSLQNGGGSLTGDDLKAMVFNIVDADGSGDINEQEVVAALTKMRMALSNQDSTFDLDGDGLVTTDGKAKARNLRISDEAEFIKQLKKIVRENKDDIGKQINVRRYYRNVRRTVRDVDLREVNKHGRNRRDGHISESELQLIRDAVNNGTGDPIQQEVYKYLLKANDPTLEGKHQDVMQLLEDRLEQVLMGGSDVGHIFRDQHLDGLLAEVANIYGDTSYTETRPVPGGQPGETEEVVVYTGITGDLHKATLDYQEEKTLIANNITVDFPNIKPLEPVPVPLDQFVLRDLIKEVEDLGAANTVDFVERADQHLAVKAHLEQHLQDIREGNSADDFHYFDLLGEIAEIYGDVAVTDTTQVPDPLPGGPPITISLDSFSGLTGSLHKGSIGYQEFTGLGDPLPLDEFAVLELIGAVDRVLNYENIDQELPKVDTATEFQEATHVLERRLLEMEIGGADIGSIFHSLQLDGLMEQMAEVFDNVPDPNRIIRADIVDPGDPTGPPVTLEFETYTGITGDLHEQVLGLQELNESGGLLPVKQETVEALLDLMKAGAGDYAETFTTRLDGHLQENAMVRDLMREYQEIITSGSDPENKLPSNMQGVLQEIAKIFGDEAMTHVTVVPDENDPGAPDITVQIDTFAGITGSLHKAFVTRPHVTFNPNSVPNFANLTFIIAKMDNAVSLIERLHP